MAIAVESQIARREPSPAMLAEMAAEAPLIAKVKAGGEDAGEAFGQLYEQTLPYVERQLRRVIGNNDLDVALQTGYLRAYEKFDRYQPTAPFRTWVARVAVNLAITEHRRNQNRPVEVDLEDMHLKEKPAPEKTDNEALAHVRDELLQEALKAVPEEQRIVLTGAYLDGKPYKKLAKEQGVPVGTIASRLFRGMKNAKQAFEAAGLNFNDF